MSLRSDEIRDVLRRALSRIAPEADLDAVPDDADLASELELDSMDVLNLVTAVAERTGVEVPEREYPTVATMNGWISYLSEAPRG